MELENSIDFSVDTVEFELNAQNYNIVQLGCWGAGSDNDSYC